MSEDRLFQVRTMKNPWAITRDYRSEDKEFSAETELPKLDLYETESHLLIDIDLPGMTPREISMQVLDNQFILEGHRESRSESGHYLRMERGKDDFRRIVGLPCTIDPERSEAKYDKGVLRLRLPKIMDRRKKPIKIPIR